MLPSTASLRIPHSLVQKVPPSFLPGAIILTVIYWMQVALHQIGVPFMAKESVQEKLSRVRPPRVHITYNVEIGDAIENKELPFVMGVLGDFGGHPAKEQLRSREFVEINPDNFDEVLRKMNPRVAFKVPNMLANVTEPELSVQLDFEKLTDFDPEQVAQKIGPIREWLELRTKLADLRGSLQGNPEFEDMLQRLLRNPEQQQQVSKELTEKGDDHA